jgi:Domain of unknown function (DUF4388)
MESGLLTSENLPSVLRSISQLRRQGILEIQRDESVFQILFVQGKVVEVVVNGVSGAHQVATRMTQAGILSAGDLEDLTYSELFRELNQRGSVIDEEFFKRVVKHTVLDQLYGLDPSENSIFSFSVKMVEVDQHFSPAISVGQLLLDLVQYKADRSRFDALFDDQLLLSRADAGDEPLSEEERIVYELLDSACSLEELRRCSMLSRFHLQETLLALYERGLVLLDDLVPAGEASSAPVASPIDKTPEAATPAAAQIVFKRPSLYSRVRGRIGLASSRALQATWIVHVVVVLFLAVSLVVPIFLWRELVLPF